ncbi:MAG TPA: alpha/beta hydrolase [Mycobacteriales bacterium]|jgi:acetyl esterase/lipase|nr:alpha/beta hydrolase [Mycobacteriales bacterium]
MPLPLPLQIARSALSRPPRTRYGPDPDQVADLHLPAGPGPHPVAVVLHGGHWQQRYGRLVCRPMSRALAARGIAAWNLEYRRLGGGGGWPATFEDVADGIDRLADVRRARLDLRRVAVVGHSAGGQLALWAAGRARLPAGAVGATPRVPVACVVALAPVTALRRAGRHAVELVGGLPDAHPDRWAQADPLAAAPPPVPALVVHPADDRTVPVARSVEYAARCVSAGGQVELVTPPGESHRDAIDPASASWAAAAGWLHERLSAP